MKAPRLLRNRAFLAICLAVSFAYVGAGMISTVRVLYVQGKGGSLEIISAMAAAFLISNFAFQYPWGWLSDRVGRRRVLLVGLLIQAVITLGYLVVSDPVVFVCLRFLEGASAASVLPAARAAVADITPEEDRGQAYGIFSAFFNLGFLFGPALGGLLAAIDYNAVFIISVAVRLIGAAIVWIGVTGSLRHAPSIDHAQRPSTGSLLNIPLLAAYVIAFGDYLWLGFDLTVGPLWMRYNLGASLPLIGLAYSMWAVPGALLAPFGGKLADTYRRSALVLIGGLAQVPLYLVYARATSIEPLIILFAVQACFYQLVSPATDAHLAHFSPLRRRGRAQSLYTGAGLLGAFVGTAQAEFRSICRRMSAP